MKTKMLFLIPAFCLLVFLLQAQDDAYNGTSSNSSSGKINSGFVFINGKYIDAPYKLKIKQGVIYINEIPVTAVLKKKRTEKYKVRKKPVVPDQITSWSEFINYQTKDNKKLFFKFLYYFYENFPEDEARVQMITLIKSLPFVKNVEEILHNKGIDEALGYLENIDFKGDAEKNEENAKALLIQAGLYDIKNEHSKAEGSYRESIKFNRTFSNTLSFVKFSFLIN